MIHELVVPPADAVPDKSDAEMIALQAARVWRDRQRSAPVPRREPGCIATLVAWCFPRALLGLAGFYAFALTLWSIAGDPA